MSRWWAGDRRDAAALFLDWTVPLLPDTRRQWGRAMQAELAGLGPSADRWRFAGGCALAILRRPSLGALGALLVPVGFVVATVRLTAGTAYLPLHLVLIAMVIVLAALYLCGDRVELFVPRRTGSHVAGAVRVGGALTLGWLALGIVLSHRSGDGNVVDRASTGVPIFTVLLGLCLVGFLALTSPALADNRVLTRGVGLGVLAAVAWLATALAALPIPPVKCVGVPDPGGRDPDRSGPGRATR